jgi:hypothetical protein
MRRPHWLPSHAAAVAALALAGTCLGGICLAAASGPPATGAEPPGGVSGPLAAAGGSPATSSGPPAVASGPPAAASAPVVVELFTSQGCATCPPADHLLSQLGSQGEQVIALAYHVDYWNQLGWSDPFSSRKWSERQERYGRMLGVGSIYTPQLVVNGRAECVGNKRDDVLRKIADARSAEAAAKVSLAAEEVGEGRGRKVRIKVGARVERPGQGLDLWVALTQSGLSTAVRAGENKSATLHDDFVVRQLRKAFSIPGKRGAERSGELTIDVDSDWGEAPRLAVVAFVQEPSTLAIRGAAAQALDAAR